VANYDAIIVGAGHNGLVAAAYLARAGKKVLILERRETVGGIAVSEEIYPGFKFSTCAHLAASFAREIAADLELKKHGLEMLQLDPLIFSPSREGPSLRISRDPAKALAEIGDASKRDAQNYQSFCALLERLGSFLRTLYGVKLPDKSNPESLNPAGLLKTGWRFRRLGEKEMYEFLRILPMSAADLLNEWFENDPLKGALAGSAMLASFVGPRQQGTAFNLLHHQLGESNGALRTGGFVRGGIGNLTQSLARTAQGFGAEIRTLAEVARIVARRGAATGVVLTGGDEISAPVVVANTDAKRTFLKLVEPTYLDPLFLLQVDNIRSRGTVAKINLALDALPKFQNSNDQSADLAGVIQIGPTLDYLERAADDAKYGRFSKQPFLEITIPSIADPTISPAGKHVMSVWMQSAPFRLRESNWNDQRDSLGETAVNVIEEYAPGFKSSILHRQVLTPLDLQETYGLTGGHLYHAEMALDQTFFMRPVPGWARYHTPIENLFLCGSGTHPGGGITGLPGYYAAREILRRRPRRR
jgi:phytoene dehydrogenase-like protein